MDQKLLTEQLMKDIEQYSSLMFSRDEIAEILELQADDFSEMLDTNDDAYKALRKGRLIQEAKLRKAIFDLAANGSSPAQTLAAAMITDAKMTD